MVTAFEVYLFAFAVLAAFFALFFGLWLSWWLTRKDTALSPYTGLPLRRASGISYFALERVNRFIFERHSLENRLFNIKKAALCRETGRIFPNCITWYDAIRLDWSFIQKRYPGNYVSWGSLTEGQQEAVRAVHDTLNGFQTLYSSARPSPRLVESQYAMEKPGPLYVEIGTGTLMGWMGVPDTELEVLIVQRPAKVITITVESK